MIYMEALAMDFASQLQLVPLATIESFWVFLGLCLALWAIFAAVAKTAEDSRGHAAATERKRCRHCQIEHPGFAAYCRQCGHRF